MRNLLENDLKTPTFFQICYRTGSKFMIWTIELGHFSDRGKTIELGGFIGRAEHPRTIFLRVSPPDPPFRWQIYPSTPGQTSEYFPHQTLDDQNAMFLSSFYHQMTLIFFFISNKKSKNYQHIFLSLNTPEGSRSHQRALNFKIFLGGRTPPKPPYRYALAILAYFLFFENSDFKPCSPFFALSNRG